MGLFLSHFLSFICFGSKVAIQLIKVCVFYSTEISFIFFKCVHDCSLGHHYKGLFTNFVNNFNIYFILGLVAIGYLSSFRPKFSGLQYKAWFFYVCRCVLVFPKIMFSNIIQIIFSCAFKKCLQILTHLYRITDYSFRFQLLVFILVTALLVSIKD